MNTTVIPDRPPTEQPSDMSEIERDLPISPDELPDPVHMPLSTRMFLAYTDWLIEGGPLAGEGLR